MATKAPLKATTRKGYGQPPWTYQRDREWHTKEGENQPDVFQPVPAVRIQRGVVLIPDREGKIPTGRGVGRVIQVPSKVSNELVRPSHPCLVRGWVEDGEFSGVAGDFEAAVEMARSPLERKKEGKGYSKIFPGSPKELCLTRTKRTKRKKRKEESE